MQLTNMIFGLDASLYGALCLSRRYVVHEEVATLVPDRRLISVSSQFFFVLLLGVVDTSRRPPSPAGNLGATNAK